MAQKISIHIGNMTADDAIALVEELLETQLPEDARNDIRNMAAATGTVPKGQFLNSERIEVPAPNELDALLSDIEQLFGKAPDYNGVLGDSCDCPACNLRRADPDSGPYPLRDLDELKLTPDESRAIVVAGYAKTGRTPPKDALDGSNAADQIMKYALNEMGNSFDALLADILPPKSARH